MSEFVNGYPVPVYVMFKFTMLTRRLRHNNILLKVRVQSGVIKNN